MIKKYLLSIFFMLNYSFMAMEYELPSSSVENWEILLDDKIWVSA